LIELTDWSIFLNTISLIIHDSSRIRRDLK